MPKDTHKTIHSHLFVAKTGLGKSFKANQVLKEALKHVPKENRYLVSPTAKNDMDDTLMGEFHEDQVQEKLTAEYIDALLLMIGDIREKVTEDFLYRYDGDFNKIKRKHPKGAEPQYPEFVLMLDDSIAQLGAGKRSVDSLMELLTKNRHYKLHVLITSQYFMAVNPVIRTNTKILYFWSCNNRELNKIADDVNIFSNKDDFKEYFKFITSKPYGCFMVNYNHRGKKIYDDNEFTFEEFKVLRDDDLLSDYDSDDD